MSLSDPGEPHFRWWIKYLRRSHLGRLDPNHRACLYDHLSGELVNSDDISDGYHTFGELYQHRQALFIALIRSHPELAWRSHWHGDGSMHEGMFIAGLVLPTGQISYHLPIAQWPLLDGIRTDEGVPIWDGHSSADVVTRLMGWAAGMASS